MPTANVGRIVKMVMSTLSASLGLSACSPFVTYNDESTNYEAGQVQPLARGEILYGVPRTRLTLSDVPAPASTAEAKPPLPASAADACAESAYTCWKCIGVTTSSFVPSGQTVRISPTSWSLFYGRTDLSAVPAADSEPRLPKTVSVLYTNTTANAIAAEGQFSFRRQPLV